MPHGAEPGPRLRWAVAFERLRNSIQMRASPLGGQPDDVLRLDRGALEAVREALFDLTVSDDQPSSGGADGARPAGVDGRFSAREAARDLAAALRMLRLETESGNGDDDPAEGEHGVAAHARVTPARRRVAQLCVDLDAFACQQALVPTRIVLLPFLSSLAHLLRLSLDQRIDVRVQVPHDCPPARGDSRALESALIHLALNARDAMPKGGILGFSAAAARADSGEPMVMIVATDTGTGMSEEVLRQASAPFFTSKHCDRFAGMGLAAVEGFAVQSGGQMSIHSRPGQGTKVALQLPVN